MTTHRSLRRAAVALLGVLVVAFGVIVPATTAEAAFGKPTSVDAKAISGSNGLTVTWKAPSGGTPVAYKVTWGTSSSSSKASYSTYVTGTSATLSASGMTTKTYYYVWVQPWSEAKSTGTSTGELSSSDKVKTSSYAYYAPVEVHVANVGKTTAEITWRTVTGSPGYVMRAYNYTTKTYKYQIGYDGSTTFTGLTPGTKYKFTIANRLLISGYDTVPGVRMSGYSSASATGTTNASTVTLGDGSSISVADAPTGLAMTDRDHQSLTLSWTTPSGYSSSRDVFKVTACEDQIMKADCVTSTNLTGSSGTITGLDSNTNYYVRVRMFAVVNGVTTADSDRSDYIMAKTRSPKGFISGTVSGVSGSVLSDYVAVAYAASDGEVNQQVAVSSGGAYKLELRPGKYFVQIIYVGSGNYYSVFLNGSGQTYTLNEAKLATGITVNIGNTPTVAPGATVGAGASLTGKVTNSKGTAVRDVYVSARDAWTDTVREVQSMGQTGSDGTYTLTGLVPNHDYYIRADPSTDTYSPKSASGSFSTGAAGSTNSVTTIAFS
ncbi:MAG: fibronectin type III domain-containing protein [Propionicimonas sp.]|uniref:fibronectin type III domain-containing protein n=1 Tax=Propionicimonas sp. TaxID=1955623 RepID=UPI003D11D6BF